MLKTFLLVAFRSLKKNRLSTFINIAGLVLGFSTFVLLSLSVYNDLSYDQWHEKADRTYRFTTIDEALGVTSNQVAITNPRMPVAAKEEIPEVEIASRVLYAGNQRMEKGDQAYYSQHGLYVENDFFEIFDLPLKNRSEALRKFNQPHKLILTESFAQTIFGINEKTVGEVLTINDQSWEVVGLMEESGRNSHLEYDLIMSLYPAQADSNIANYIESWNGLGMIGYAVLAEGTNEQSVEAKMAEIAIKNDVNDFWIPQLQPLTDIHLGSSGILFDYYHQNKGDKVYTYALAGVALFILLIATFNFINLTTAQSTTRAKEVGIRKVVGSSKSQLVSQHLIESMVLALFAMLLSMALVFATSGFATGILNFSVSDLLLQNPLILFGFILLSIFVGALAGIYPSFILSNIKSISILAGRFQTSSDGIWLRKTLVVLQFVAAIGMICTTLIVSKQIDFIKNKSLGFDKEQIVTFSMTDQSQAERMISFREKLSENPSILNATFSNNMPGRTFGRGSVNLPDGNQDEPWIVSVLSVDEDYFPTLGIKLAAGRNYSESYGADQQESIIINQAMAESLGLQDPVGKKLTFGSNTTRTVVGVIENFHFSNMRHKIEPLMVFYNPGPNGNFSVKIRPEDMQGTMKYLETAWLEVLPNYPFEYRFFDEEFNEIFASDEHFSKLISVFTWLSIALSAMGLFGLSFFLVEQRKKEIGVRKVLGSSIGQIVGLVMREFVWLIILANLIAWPVAYFFAKRWINDFQYRIELLSIENLSIYAFAGLGALIIAMIAVSYKSIRAALANPIESLRDE